MIHSPVCDTSILFSPWGFCFLRSSPVLTVFADVDRNIFVWMETHVNKCYVLRPFKKKLSPSQAWKMIRRTDPDEGELHL